PRTRPITSPKITRDLRCQTTVSRLGAPDVVDDSGKSRSRSSVSVATARGPFKGVGARSGMFRVGAGGHAGPAVVSVVWRAECGDFPSALSVSLATVRRGAGVRLLTA